MSNSTLHRFALVCAVTAMLTACAVPARPAAPAAPAAPAPAAPAPAAQASVEKWTADDVKNATGKDQCTPVAQLPKTFKQPWKLAFLQPNKGNPFWGAVGQSMANAAKFYGVDFTEIDSAGDATKYPDLLETALLKKPNVIGNGGSGPETYEALAARAQEVGTTWLGFDNGPSAYSPYTYGIPDNFAGKTGAELLIKGVEDRQKADWKGKEVFFIEFTHKGIPACVNRTGGAVQAFKSHFKLDDKHVLLVDVATGQSAADGIKAVLTAHPDGVFGLIPCWDGLGIDAYNAAKDAGREKNILMVTLGGDKPPADLLVTKPMSYYGYVEFQPACEGWSWVETALAIQEGVPFQPYQTRRVTTQADIDARYKELYGDPPK